MVEEEELFVGEAVDAGEVVGEEDVEVAEDDVAGAGGVLFEVEGRSGEMGDDGGPYGRAGKMG